jgi:hypothetical protein
MFAMVSFRGPLNVEKFAVEDELETAFTGVGEVTGAGVGKTGSHLDLEVNDELSVEDVHSRITGVLLALGVTTPAKIVIGSQEFMYEPSGAGTGGQHDDTNS